MRPQQYFVAPAVQPPVLSKPCFSVHKSLACTDDYMFSGLFNVGKD